jgi:hypothetical protein
MIPVILAIMSVAAYVLARRSGRNRLIWIALVWILGFAGGLICVMAAIEVALRTLGPYVVSDKGAYYIGVVASLSGTLMGAGLALWGASRKRVSA